jgi:hypothetical protein
VQPRLILPRLGEAGNTRAVERDRATYICRSRDRVVADSSAHHPLSFSPDLISAETTPHTENGLTPIGSAQRYVTRSLPSSRNSGDVL